MPWTANNANGANEELQRTLPLNFSNREQRERYEQGETDYTNYRGYNCNEHSIFYFTSLPPKPLQSYKGHSIICSQFSRISRLEIQRTLPLESWTANNAKGTNKKKQTVQTFAVKITAYTPVENHEPRTTRTARTVLKIRPWAPVCSSALRGSQWVSLAGAFPEKNIFWKPFFAGFD